MKSRTTPSHTPPLHLAQPGQHPADYFIQDFLHAKATKAPKTVQFYELGLRLYREHVGLHWPPTDSSINSFLAECKSRGCKDGTLHAYYRALKTWCNWLYKRGKIEENPISLVEEPPRGKKLPRAPRAADIEKLFEALEAAAVLGKWNHIRDLALFGLMYETGIRVNEALTLETGDLSTRFCVALIRDTKTDEDRAVVFDEQTGEDLRRWLRVRDGLDPPAELQTVFISQPRRYSSAGPLTSSGIRRALERWCERAGIPPLHPHALRHAYAIHALRAGADLLDVKAQMGHRNLSTTQRYAMATGAGRRQRHAQHSPRSNLSQIAANEQEDLYPLIPNKAVRIESQRAQSQSPTSNQ
jgi:site-specific recombinase XerD